MIKTEKNDTPKSFNNSFFEQQIWILRIISDGSCDNDLKNSALK